MPRTKRCVPLDGYLHIICRGNNKQFIFHSPVDYRYYYNLLIDHCEENKIEINHYCLMNNHLHLVVHTIPESNIARYMKQVNLMYFGHYRRKYGYSGHLWQGRFKSRIIEDGSYLIKCGKYIEMNPVKAGIIDHPREYAYSSFPHYAYGRKDKLIKENPEYLEMGNNEKEKRKAYREFVVDEEMEQRYEKQQYVGSNEFIKKMEEYYEIKNTNKKRGPKIKKNRPQKDK